MSLDSSFHMAAKRARTAIKRTIGKYRDGLVNDEDDITGVLIGNLDSELNDVLDGFRWSTAIVRHRKGVAAQEKLIGADIIIHISIDTPELTYSKGVLIQAKRIFRDAQLSARARQDLFDQCNKMLSITSSSFVFNYGERDIRVGPASRVVGSGDSKIYDHFILTSYRFFFEFFRCPSGDHRITSAKFDELPVPHKLRISVLRELSSEVVETVPPNGGRTRSRVKTKDA